MNFETLEDRVALDADGVYGPAIPDHLDYVPPPKLLRGPYYEDVNVVIQGQPHPLSDIIDNTPVQQLEDQHPIPAEGFIDRDQIWDNDLHAMFSAFASDGEITTREARDLVVSTDDGGYTSRFEVYQLYNYIYSSDYNDLYNRQSQVFMMLLAEDNTGLANPDVSIEAGFLQEGIDAIQPVADYWYFVTTIN